MTRTQNDRRRGRSFKIPEDGAGWDIGRKSFTVRVRKPWHRLPKEAVAAPSLEMLKAMLGEAWSSLV